MKKTNRNQHPNQDEHMTTQHNGDSMSEHNHRSLLIAALRRAKSRGDWKAYDLIRKALRVH